MARDMEETEVSTRVQTLGGYADRDDGVGGYVTPQHERGRHPEYRRHQQRTADWLAGQEAEEFVAAVGSAIDLAEQLAGSYTQPRETFHARAVALRECADRLIELAGRMR